MNNPHACEVVQPGDTRAASEPYVFRTLTTAVLTSGPNADKLVLSGTAAISDTTRIGSVGTMAVAGTNPRTAFTGRELTPDIPVSAGQMVTVTVVISFASGT